MRDSAPSEDDIKQIKIKADRLAISSKTSISKSRQNKGFEEITKLQAAANEFKQLIVWWHD
jgi:hypothetical protein